VLKPVAIRHRRWEIATLVALTLGAVFLSARLTPHGRAHDDRMLSAAQRMAEATTVVADHRAAHGPPFSPEDVNRTGLIGTFFGPLTTTVGTLEAKRTTTNPNLAAVASQLLIEAGVRDGDAIAVGASGSFPAVLLAVLCAAHALDLDVGLIIALGASQWGANLVEFTWLEMQGILVSADLLPASYRAAAVSFGGANDVGTDLDRDVLDVLRARVHASGIPLLEEPDLQTNVAERMRIYNHAVNGRPISAFINIGGAWANLGTGAAALQLEPGVSVIETVPCAEERGALFEFAARGVPVVHFLQISGLASAHGLPWDPSPLPAPTKPAMSRSASPVAVRAIAAAYILLSCLWLVSIRWRPRLRRTHGEP